MAEFKPVMINNNNSLDSTVGAMNVDKSTGDITFVTNGGNVVNKNGVDEATTDTLGTVKLADTTQIDNVSGNGVITASMLDTILKKKYG